jgi:hypothetical protein
MVIPRIHIHTLKRLDGLTEYLRCKLYIHVLSFSLLSPLLHGGLSCRAAASVIDGATPGRWANE